jgi:hypothetical protein
MTKRISPKVKAIADAHLEAKLRGYFDDPRVTTRDEVIDSLSAGKTFSEVLSQIEIRFCSITSMMLASNVLRLNGDVGYLSANYKRDVYRGFKALLPNL